MPLLVEVCPSYAPMWAQHVADDPACDLLYIDLPDFASHLIALTRRGETAELPAVFAIIERIDAEGDRYTQEAITIGLLEDIQGLSPSAGLDPEAFRGYLGPRTAHWWDELYRFWGRSP